MFGIFLFIFPLFMPSFQRILFFGRSHAGKTRLINNCCDLNLPVASEDSFESTTKQISSHRCLENIVIDTVGLFDYSVSASETISVNDALTMILEYISLEGLSGVVWVWNTRYSLGDKELEEIFSTLIKLLPDFIPMLIVENTYAGLRTGAPSNLAYKFGIPLIKANLTDVEQLKNWIKDHKAVYKIKLPENWRRLIQIEDFDRLGGLILEVNQEFCSFVKYFIRDLNDKINQIIEAPLKNCDYCNQNCTVQGIKCRPLWVKARFDICLLKTIISWEEHECLENISECHQTCKEEILRIELAAQSKIKDLEDQLLDFKTKNAAILRACDKLKL